jgi:hypothetical protein
VRCQSCGGEHDLMDLEPSFHRPEQVVTLSADVRASRVTEDDDLCRIAPAAAESYRYFVRCVLPVQLLDIGRSFNWGLWAEVEQPAFRRVVDLWQDPQQAAEPPMKAILASQVPCSPDTMGLPALLRLTGPATRPALSFDRAVSHPFVAECASGVLSHRLAEWLQAMK